MAVKSAENTAREKIRNKKDGSDPVGIKTAGTTSRGGRSGARNLAQKLLPSTSSWLLAIQRETAEKLLHRHSPSAPHQGPRNPPITKV